MDGWCQIVEGLESREKKFNLDVVRVSSILRTSWRMATKNQVHQPGDNCNN